MQGKNYIEMQTLVSIDLGPVVLKPNTDLLVNIDGSIVDIRSDGFEMTTSKKLLELKTNRTLDELFISKKEVESAMTYGSEIKLLTDRGLITYSIEDISFKNDGITYATLGLKAI